MDDVIIDGVSSEFIDNLHDVLYGEVLDDNVYNYKVNFQSAIDMTSVYMYFALLLGLVFAVGCKIINLGINALTGRVRWE